MRCEQARGGVRAPRARSDRRTGGRVALAALACLAFLLCLTVMPAMARAEEGLYGVLSEDGATLTYYYGEHDVVWSNDYESESSGPIDSSWFPTKEEADKVTKVVFDDSARAFRPKTLRCFFATVGLHGGWNEGYGRPNLRTIEGLGKIDLSDCANLYATFYHCSSLVSLDLSGWKTSSVTSMSSLFKGCSSLTSLDLSGWDTSSMVDSGMSNMFYGCSSLSRLTLGKEFKYVIWSELRDDVCWRSSADGQLYEASKIPKFAAATYTAEYPADKPGDPGTSTPVTVRQSMYRLYNPYSGEHFYTASADEMGHLASIGWSYEGVGWVAPKQSNTPVYRLYNP